MACGYAVGSRLKRCGDVLVGEEETDVDMAHLLGEGVTVFGIVYAGIAQIFVGDIAALLIEDVGCVAVLVDDGACCHLHGGVET